MNDLMFVLRLSAMSVNLPTYRKPETPRAQTSDIF